MNLSRISPVLSIHERASQFIKRTLNLAEIRLYAYDVFYNKRLSPALERRYRVEGLPLDDVRYTAARDKAFRECRPAQMTPAAFVAHVLSGAAWTPGYFSGETYGSGRYFRRRNKDWRASQFLALDFDDNVSVADCLRYDLVSQYALLVHPSASSKATHYKTRVILMLDGPMTGDVETWKRAQRALIAQFEQAADPQSIVASQPYFGSTNTVEPPHVNLSARLPLTIALEWAAEVAQQDAQKEAERRARRDAVKRVTVTGDRAEKYAQAAFDRLISDMTGAAKGTHHAALVKTAAQLASMAAGGWPVGEWEALLKKAAAPRASESEIKNAITWAIEGADPRPLELPKRQHRSARRAQDAPKQPYKINHPHTPLKGARVVNQRYVELPDDIDRYKVVVIRSPIATGKTRAALALAQRARTVVHMSHRRKLAENAANNANQHGVTFEYYRELRRDDMRRVPKHSTCINTYASLATVDESIPVPDLL
ncbi:MAG: hypothetical protein KC519_20470, partial [Anaerolineae bacterium]|nr:hypothetical protein [Anaerolineae bacterium]